MDGRSHGEQFLELLQSRLVPRGLYLLDEPEAPLSPQRQLALISLLKEASTERECQFVIATHSPLLMATPDSTILSVRRRCHRTRRLGRPGARSTGARLLEPTGGFPQAPVASDALNPKTCRSMR